MKKELRVREGDGGLRYGDVCNLEGGKGGNEGSKEGGKAEGCDTGGQCGSNGVMQAKGREKLEKIGKQNKLDDGCSKGTGNEGVAGVGQRTQWNSGKRESKPESKRRHHQKSTPESVHVSSLNGEDLQRTN